MHSSNPDVIKLGDSIGRTAGAIAMKMVNFASLDPIQQGRGIKGLKHGSKWDKKIWEEFHNNWEGLAFESQQSFDRLLGEVEEKESTDIPTLAEDIQTEGERTVRVRLVQRFFRQSVLSAYNYSCTICNLGLSSMLNASHIVPWSVDKDRRADPSNGLSLCAFHDRAFDRGLITIDEDFQVVVSGEAKEASESKMHKVGFLEIQGRGIAIPDKFKPDQVALAYHREKIFLQ
jgi:predicted restriction endonuclease